MPKAAGLVPLARDSGPRHPRAGSGLVYHCTDRRDAKVLDKTGWTVGDVDLFEINEAFAVVTMAAMRDLGLVARQGERARRRLCAGPPIGASGTRIVVSLIYALQQYGKKRGVASSVHWRR